MTPTVSDCWLVTGINKGVCLLLFFFFLLFVAVSTVNPIGKNKDDACESLAF